MLADVVITSYNTFVKTKLNQLGQLAELLRAQLLQSHTKYLLVME
jgi:hypothetical protein